MGDEALVSLERLQGDLYPNGLWYESPCIESSLAAANIIQEMMLQSWSDPALAESGPIRIFPAMPSAWKDAEFQDLRAEGGFLVSAKMEGGTLKWVLIKSLAGEPCRVRADLGDQPIAGNWQQLKLEQIRPGVYEIGIGKGESAILVPTN